MTSISLLPTFYCEFQTVYLLNGTLFLSRTSLQKILRSESEYYDSMF